MSADVGWLEIRIRQERAHVVRLEAIGNADAARVHADRVDRLLDRYAAATGIPRAECVVEDA